MLVPGQGEENQAAAPMQPNEVRDDRSMFEEQKQPADDMQIDSSSKPEE